MVDAASSQSPIDRLLRHLVVDWDGFEALIARMHEDGTVSVRRGVALDGKSGATRKIDVVLDHEQGPHSYRTLIECKLWGRRVERSDVDVLAASIDDLEASSGAIFTTVGYQSGAKEYAASKKIDLFVVRDLMDDEWGAPGRVVELYLQFFSPSVRNLRSLSVAPDSNNLRQPVTLSLGHGAPRSSDQNAAKLENKINDCAASITQDIRNRGYLLSSGEDCTRYFVTEVRMPLNPPLKLTISDGATSHLVLELQLEVVTRVEQSKLRFDRGEQLDWALAVENCVTGARFTNFRRSGKPASQWTAHALSKPQSSPDQVVKNGSIIGICMKGWFDPAEVDGMEQVDLRDRLGPLPAT